MRAHRSERLQDRSSQELIPYNKGVVSSEEGTGKYDERRQDAL